MEKPEPLASQLSPEERQIIQWLGGQLDRILQGQYEDLPLLDRRDELGILATMVDRIASELKHARERDERQRGELERRVLELEEVRRVQDELLEWVRQLSSPLLAIHEGILLLPIVGVVDTARAQRATVKLLDRVQATGAEVVIFDVTGVSSIDAGTADLLLQATAAISLLGARPILCGVTPALAKIMVELGLDFSSMTPCSDLQGALSMALRLLDRRERVPKEGA